MYFSKNSRCVLQRVRFLSPNFLKSNNQNLCVKKPKDDPTKPPLRVNIPKDFPSNDGLPKLIQNSFAVSESNSKSLLRESKSTSFSPNLDGDFLYKSDSEIQFTPLGGNDASINCNEKETASTEAFNPQVTSVSQNKDYNEGLRTVFNEEETEKALSEILLTDTAAKPSDRGKVSERKNIEISIRNQLDDCSSCKSLYIIIDVPQKYASEEIVHSIKNKNINPKEQVGSKTNRQKSESFLLKKGYSFPKFDKSKSKFNRNFEVHEIEDESTYVFHLRFNPSHSKKSCGVDRVPEKEVTTRNENLNYDEVPIKMKKSTFSRQSRSGKENTIRENESKTSSLALSKKPEHEAPQSEPELGPTGFTIVSDRSPQNFQPTNVVKMASYCREKRKSPQRLEKNEKSKKNSFKVSGKTTETKQEENGLRESLFAPPTENKQKGHTEASSDPAAKMTDMSKVEKKATSEGRRNFFPNTDKSFSSKLKRLTKNRAAHATDIYALYLGTRQRAQATTEKSVDSHKKSKSSEYLSTYGKEPVQSKSSSESIFNRNCVQCFTSFEDTQLNAEPQYMSIYEKPKTNTSQTSVKSKRKKNNLQAIDTEKSNIKPQNSAKNIENYKKPLKKKFNENCIKENLEVESSRLDKVKNEVADFQVSPPLISIGCDKASNSPATFGAAFPPFLSEALNSRLKFKKDLLLSTKWTKTEVGSKGKNPNFSPKSKVTELSENSILFPKKESENFDCDSLFNSKEVIILNIIKNEEESSSKTSDNVANVANGNLTEHQAKSSVDSLSMMKKVKEIVQFDFENAVKIFKNGGSKSSEELPSVVILKGDLWEIDTKELDKQMEMRKNEMKIHEWIDSYRKADDKLKNDILGDKTEVKVPKYLPSRKENLNEMKLFNNHLCSVITYNPKTKTFFIDEKAFADAKNQRIKESFGEISQNFDILVKSSENSLETKSGDSILVFDEESQSWRVDFSILEKREQQLQIEKELTKRSEIILETFENLEKDQVSTFPKPDSNDTKTFDYQTEKWKIYDKEKKSTKSKSPFRESDAEEIRRKNSDLYDNLFIAKKKDTTMKKVEKIAPGIDSSKTSKKSRSGTSCENNMPSESNSLKCSGSAPKNSNPSNSQPTMPPANQKKPPEKEDDSFWESFLKMNILPRDVREISNIAPLSKPLLPENQPLSKTPSLSKIEDPKLKIPEKKIEEPKSKIPEKKIEEPKLKTPEKKINEPKLKTPEKKINEPKLKTPEGKTEEPKLKTPEGKTEEPKLKTPEGKTEEPKPKIPDNKIEDSKLKFQIPFIKDKIVDLSIKMIKQVPKEKTKKKDEKTAPPPAGADPENKKPPEKKAPPPSGAGPDNKKTPEKKAPPPAGADPDNKKTPEKKAPPPSGAGPESQKPPEKKAPPPPTSTPQKEPKSSPTGSSKEPSKPAPPSGKPPQGKMQDPKGKNEKIASPADHYVSDKIIEISKNKTKENVPKTKTNKMETVKLNITADKRLPSKITEINLSKKFEEKPKEPTEAQPNSVPANKFTDLALAESEKPSEGKKMFYKSLEKYKTPFSDPEYEENSTKIKSDIESNPNLKKLDNLNKTLVLHDIMKPSENIDSWLKDETDKMATLLLRILQEAANGKPKKKQSSSKTKSIDKNSGKGSPYENIRKKQEVTPENFLFRVRTVNVSLEDDKKSKQGGVKVMIKSEKLKDAPVQSNKNPKPTEVINAIKFVSLEKDAPGPTKGPQLPERLDVAKPKVTETSLETLMDSAIMARELSQPSKLPIEITDKIPGPEILKKISNTWKAFPILGSQMTIFTLFRLFQLANLGSSMFGTSSSNKGKKFAFSKLFTKYGPIVNVQGPLSGNVILIHKPEHLTTIFDQDVALFVRSVFDSLEKIRLDSEEKTSVNISTDWTKPEWNHLKRGTEDPLFRGGEKYFRTAEITGNSLLNNVRKNKNAQGLVSEDFMEEIKKWSLEGLCSVLFEKSFGFLEGRTNNMNWIMEPDKLYMAIDEVTRCLNNCERGFQVWRLMATPSSMAMGQAYRTISSICQKQLYQAEINLKNKSELLKEGIFSPVRDLSFIESMLLNDGMTIEEITCNLVDIMLIGTNVMNSAMGFLLYNLAQNVKAQNKLLKELKEVLPHKNSPLELNKLQSLKYLHACLSESLRLHVPIPIFYKMLQNDILLANYVVPKGTYVVMDFRVSCMKEQIFDDPDKYVPERWLNDEKWVHEIHPFTSFPLCHGPRAELAKRIVEVQLLTCIAKIVRNFQIEYHYGEIVDTNSLMAFPDKPLKLNFIERES